jgi:hypothetical protein
MSMICNLRRVADDDIRRLLASPRQITRFLYGNDFSPPAVPVAVLLGRLFGRSGAAAPPPEWPPRREGDEVNLDKAWHGLHFLFTGSASEGEEPGCYLVQGGTAIGNEDVGYGPARALRPAEVAKFAAFLRSQSEAELQRRFDPLRMTQLEIYPEIWEESESEEDSAIDYLLGGFETLREFVDAASKAGDGLIIYLN